VSSTERKPNQDPSAESPRAKVDALGALLKEADPLRDEPEIPEVDAQIMRRVVMSATQPATEHPGWRFMAWAAAGVALVVAAGIGLERWRPREAGQTAGGGGADLSGAPASDLEMRRQLQFATPGGTRVIWVFDSRFKP
jgi:hypothetical protein